MKLTSSEIGLIITLLILSFIGFIIKLPTIFRPYGFELHFLFYLLAALFFYKNFGRNKISNHVIIFILLLFFGIGIEVIQSLSNLFFDKKIHGNFDPVDIFCNVLGLIVATIFWVVSLIVKKIINN